MKTYSVLNPTVASIVSENFAVSDGNNNIHVIDRNYANRDKMNNRLEARRFQLTRRLISDQTVESLEITQGKKNLIPSKN